jgi:hypothetical protein
LSIRRGGATVAVDWLRRAAHLCTDTARRTKLLGDAAFVASQAGRLADVEQILTTAEMDHPQDASAVLTNAYLAFYRDGEVIETHRQLVTRSTPGTGSTTRC